MINFLMLLHFKQSFGLYMPISPPDIPFRTFRIFFYFEFELLSNSTKHIILAIYMRRCVPDRFIIILSNLIFWIQLALNLGGIGSPCCRYLSLSSRVVFSLSLFFRFICYYNLILQNKNC